VETGCITRDDATLASWSGCDSCTCICCGMIRWWWGGAEMHTRWRAHGEYRDFGFGWQHALLRDARGEAVQHTFLLKRCTGWRGAGPSDRTERTGHRHRHSATQHVLLVCCNRRVECLISSTHSARGRVRGGAGSVRHRVHRPDPPPAARDAHEILYEKARRAISGLSPPSALRARTHRWRLHAAPLPVLRAGKLHDPLGDSDVAVAHVGPGGCHPSSRVSGGKEERAEKERAAGRRPSSARMHESAQRAHSLDSHGAASSAFGASSLSHLQRVPSACGLTLSPPPSPAIWCMRRVARTRVRPLALSPSLPLTSAARPPAERLN